MLKCKEACANQRIPLKGQQFFSSCHESRCRPYGGKETDIPHVTVIEKGLLISYVTICALMAILIRDVGSIVRLHNEQL